MTRLLEKAFAQASSLSEPTQDWLAGRLLRAIAADQEGGSTALEGRSEEEGAAGQEALSRQQREEESPGAEMR